jgi:putative tricarboxylic transport membrane protein
MRELLTGFGVALSPANLMWGLAGTTLGTAIGVLPGIGPALTVALLLPITYSLDPTAALIMFAGIYYGAMYGGSTTSILLNTPGESATIVTAIDGHQMARNGRAGAALATAAIGSFVAGTLATLALSITAPLMVRVALAFGSAEYFSLMVLAFVMVTTMLGASRLRGWLSLLLGLSLGFVGIDGLSGHARLTFGIAYLLDGIDPVIVAIGLFAVGETLWVASLGPAVDEVLPVQGSLWMTAEEWRRSWKPWLRGTAIGFPLGALPAGGAELPTLGRAAAFTLAAAVLGRIVLGLLGRASLPVRQGPLADSEGPVGSLVELGNSTNVAQQEDEADPAR